MKKTGSTIAVLVLVILLGSTILFSQNREHRKVRPKKIEGIAKEEKTVSYYTEQSLLWKQLLDEKPDNSEAWQNYYKAERAKLQLEDPDLWVNNRQLFYERLEPIISKSEGHIGNEFDFFYMKGLNSEGKSSIENLKMAYSIDPERPEVYGWLFSYYVPRFKEPECKELAGKMLTANIYSDANLKWNYNALVSVDRNGVIISNGDMDGIPKWVLQYGAGVRNDVLVVNKWFMADSEKYRIEIYERLNLSEAELGKSDFQDLAKYADYLVVDLFKRVELPMYISSGTSLKFFEENELEDKMYLVGNVLKYSTKKFDNISVIKNNFENNYFMEYIFQNFQHHHEDEIVKTQMNLTYLPSLILLREYYESVEDRHKYDHYDSLINKIASDSGKKEEVLNWFND